MLTHAVKAQAPGPAARAGAGTMNAADLARSPSPSRALEAAGRASLQGGAGAVQRKSAGGAGTAQLQPDEHQGGILSDLRDVFKALTGSKTGPLPQGPRNDLDTSLVRHKAPHFFTSMLHSTNRGMAINTDAVLPQDKADKYIHDSEAVERGEMLNSTAFWNSAGDWTRRGNYPAGMLNLLGGVASVFTPSQMGPAMEDYVLRKTGQR